MSGIVLDDGKITVNKIDKIFCLREAYILVGWEKNDKYTHRKTHSLSHSDEQYGEKWREYW